MPRSTALRAAGLLLALVLLSPLSFPAAEEPAAGTLSAAEFAKLVGQTSQIVQTALTDRPSAKARAKARTAAVLLAAVAQFGNAGTDAQQRATVRDAAVQLADAIKQDKLDDARKQADGLARLAVNANARPQKLPLLGTHVSFAEAMKYFAPEARGGMGAEKKLDVLGDNRQAKKSGSLPRAVLTDDLLLIGFMAAVVGDMSKEQNDATVRKDPKAWRRFAEETRKAGLELAAAVRTQKGDRAWTALNRLNSACNDCHARFRE